MEHSGSERPTLLTQIQRKIAIGFGGGPYTVQQMTEAVQIAERCEFDSAWMTNDIGGRTPYVVLATWATATENIRLGVAVSNPVTRHPVELAQTVATLDEACNGRTILGLGTGISWRSIIGDQWTKPIGLMRETMQVLRELWAESETTYRGIPVSIRESDWVWPNGSPASIRKDIPIYMGARSPQMTRLGARRADGLLLELGRSVQDLKVQVAMFRATAEQAGRDSDALEVGALISTCAVRKESELEVMRRLIAFQTSRLTVEEAQRRGIEPNTFHQINDIYIRYAEPKERVMYGNEPAAYEAASSVTQEMLEAFAVVGTPDDCARQLKKYVAAGVTLPILLPTACDIGAVIEVGTAYRSLV